MKKHLLLLLLPLLVLCAKADPVEIDGIYYNLVTKAKIAEVAKTPNDTYYISNYSGNVVIPKTVTYEGVKYDVTSIGALAFANCQSLTSVTIPNSVTTICNNAFLNCNRLTSVAIPNSVTSIESSAFEECVGLTSVHISNIENWLKIEFWDNPLRYAHHLFLNGVEIKDLVIPNSVTSIGKSVFEGCSGLTSITIPNSVTSIGIAAFANCSGLTSLTIPNSVTQIEGNAFYKCTALTSITIPNSVTSIGWNVFDGCSSLTSVTIDDGVGSIGHAAFQNCTALTSITIPNSVIDIWEEAFYGCSKLKSVMIGNGVSRIWRRAFANCPELTDVYCYIEKAPDTSYDTFDGSYIEYATTLHVPQGCTDAYKSVEPWKSFKTIVEDGGTGINDIKNSATTKPFDIYDLSGRKVLSSVTSLNGLPNGVYIINGKKMIIK